MLAMSDSTAIIALGANTKSPVGRPDETLRHALVVLADRGAKILQTSPFYRTAAVPAGSGPDFVNAVVRIGSPWNAAEALDVLHGIEDGLGRNRVRRWDARSLDMDLLAMGQQVFPSAAVQASWRDLPPDRQQRDAPDRLILPHPRLQDRAFVLVPMHDVAPDWIHPLLGRSVRQMLDALPEEDRASVVPLQ